MIEFAVIAPRQQSLGDRHNRHNHYMLLACPYLPGKLTDGQIALQILEEVSSYPQSNMAMEDT